MHSSRVISLVCASFVPTALLSFYTFALTALGKFTTGWEKIGTNLELNKKSAAYRGRLHSEPELDHELWLDSEDAPEATIKHERLLSAVEIVAWYTTRSTRAIHRNHFVMRRRPDAIKRSLEL